MTDEGFERTPRPKRRGGIVTSIFYSLGYLVLIVKDAIIADLSRIWHNMRLFLGITFTTAGLLSFGSGRYCDGSVADHFSCTRPSTYYYYSEIAIIAIVLGIFLIVLWMLGRKRM